MNLYDFATEELMEEIERRKKLEEKIKESMKEEIPKFKTDQEIIKELPAIKKFLNANMMSIKNTGIPLKSFKYYCYEYLMDTFYDNIWNWYSTYKTGE